MALAPLSAGFQSLPLLPTIKLGPSGAASWVGEFVFVPGEPRTLLWVWEFLTLLPQPLPRGFQSEVWGYYFPLLELWVAQCVTWSTSCCLAGQLQLCPPHSTIRHLAGSATRLIAASPLCPAAHLRPSTSLDEWFFFISLVVGFPYNSIFCQFWLVLFLNYCCPSFGCARRHSVCTYASILASSRGMVVFYLWSLHIFKTPVFKKKLKVKRILKSKEVNKILKSENIQCIDWIWSP